MNQKMKGRSENRCARSEISHPIGCFNPPHITIRGELTLIAGVATKRQPLGSVQERVSHDLNLNRGFADWMPSGRNTGIRVSLPSIVIRISPAHGASSTGSAEMANPRANWERGIRVFPVRNSRETRAEWVVDAIMVSDLIDRASEYCRRRERELLLQNKLGSGVHGSVFACRHHYDLAGRNAVKVFERPEPYLRERDVYLRLRGLGIDNIRGHSVPQLVDVDDELLVIEMTVVTRPFVLDFAGAYLDRAPDYDAETLEEWRKEKVEQFEENWPAAESILYSLECYGIFVADVNPGNIAFVEEENP